MVFVGVDVHKSYLEIATISNDGKLESRCRIENTPESIDDLVRSLDSSAKVAMESCSYFYPLYNRLEEALSNGRTPIQILSDHGTQYWSNDADSRFTNFCKKHGIENILGSTGKPTTQGKIERFFQTFERHYSKFNDLNGFREYFNNKPHRSLGYSTPSQNYFTNCATCQ